ncbi:hypothetical protein [Paracoccus sp. (in: a-proteobacteria)]|uniref:hypothetical protein n=1 Tax=Paracoccus sp. TaxID=267 RepID=UPI0034CD3E35
MTGASKNALDQAYKDWLRKPVAPFGYGGVGGARADAGAQRRASGCRGVHKGIALGRGQADVRSG